MKVTFRLTCLLGMLVASYGLNILLVFPNPYKSHAILGEGYVRELTKAGHHVTLMTPYPSGKNTSLRTEIPVEFMVGTMHDEIFSDLTALIETKLNMFEMPAFVLETITGIHREFIQSSTVQGIIKDRRNNFDVIVVEWFFGNLLITLGQVFQCPVVIAPSTEVHEQVLELFDYTRLPSASLSIANPTPPPHESLFDRFYNLKWSIRNKWERWTRQMSVEAQLYEEFIRPAAEARGVTDLPSYETAILDVSMALYNSHPAMGFAQSLPPNVNPVGGYHIEIPTPKLPLELQKIMDSSKDGVIYFSMGSILKSENLPDEVKNSLLDAFSKLNQTVLWKLEQRFSNVPKNVILREWFPQQSVLAHPNLRIFITHGGLLSTTEAIHFGVPLIGVPIFADQFVNMAQAEKKGYALVVDARNLAKEVAEGIQTVLKNDRFTKATKLLSSYYHDRPRPPGEELVYWIEHVARTKGAPHLRSVTRHLTFVEHFYFDLLALVVLGFSILMFVCKFMFNRSRSIIKLKKN